MMMHPHSSQGDSQQAYQRLFDLFSGTTRILSRALDRLSYCGALLKAAKRGAGYDREAMLLKSLDEAAQVYNELFSAGMSLAIVAMPKSGTSETVTALAEVFGSEEAFHELITRHEFEAQVAESWITQVRDLILMARRRLKPLMARTAYAAKNGKLPQGKSPQGVLGICTNDLPSAECLANNSQPPHTISGQYDPIGGSMGPEAEQADEPDGGLGGKTFARTLYRHKTFE